MGVEMEALFTNALGLQAPWVVENVKLNTTDRRIDFEIGCQGAGLACPACGAAGQPIHDRLLRSWRHLDFFQFETWLHCEVPRIACSDCGKTTQMLVPWARPGSGFTVAFETFALALCRDLPVNQTATLLRCSDKQLWRRIEFYVEQARAQERFTDVRTVGIDETSMRRGQNYITVVHDLDAKRLLFATEGREHKTVLDFVDDLKAHGGDSAQVKHVCMDMSAAYAKGVGLALPQAQISYDRFHVVAMAMDAMDQVRRTEMAQDAPAVRVALESAVDNDEHKTLKQLMWGMRRNPEGWSAKQTDAMHWLQRSVLKSARAWRLKMALRAVYARAKEHNSVQQASVELQAWLSWAFRCRLEPFKKLARSLKERFAAVVRGMLGHRSNAYVEAMNGLLQQAKRAARGFRTSDNFITIAYLRMSKLKHLPASPFAPGGVT
ncbi:ISL3 family transposase [Verminephrobacter aporrectodeae]|uniref:ISL3 family transposase n=2 Tax=Verminephrobacter aporrectodeae TaxID=1110389 RepID=UPI0022432B29|nr:ISL3 family transposase [Verminephrobacter aporrectodeae]MCW8174513.1 ISL3 family transposase [Verminephrobacter aporrectodeae subsp. tuberculatae]MCW8202195.1 ISL3 family transposase [Verminephrobacter aporrectodeae subsp. tuberculatae]